MSVNLSPVGGVAAQFFDNDGNVLSGGLIYTYVAGSTTPQTTYTTGAGNIAHSNPIVLDSAGRVPTGEIWLTDSLVYKFVIKDSTGALIGTYDNIIGINSNFVNYTSSQEIQTATAGQTVFTLTTMVYQPGTNSLSVFVDGVNQYGPGAQYAFTETSATSVTFTNGLHVGASVKFTTSVINNVGAVYANQVTYDPPFTGSVVTNVENKLAQTVSVKDFGAVGDGVTDDTAAIQAAIDYASTNFLNVQLLGSYSISSIRIKNGLRSLTEGKLIARTQGANLVEFDCAALGGAAVSNCYIANIEMVLDAGPLYAVKGEDCTYCTFENNYLHNTTNTTNTIFGISLKTSSNNKIINNTVVLDYRHNGGQPIELYSPGVDAYWGYFANATGNITPTANPCEYNVIEGNRVYGGLQGIAIQGSNHNVISGNSIEAAGDRGIICIASVRNTISSNNIRDCGSSGIHFAYGCTQNLIEANSITNLNASGGEAGLQAYVGCGGNSFIGNNVTTNANYGVYIGVSSSFNIVANNTLQNYGIAGICVQSDWFGSGGQGVYGRPNYGAPVGSKWAFTDTVGTSIKSNYIGDSANVGNDCGIALIQLHSAAGVLTNYKVTNVDVSDNKVQTSNLTHNLYVFEDISAGVANCNLIGNTFSDPTLSKFSGNDFAYTPDGYSSAFDQISQNSGINTRQSWVPVVSGTTSAGTATYSVQSGTYTRIDKNTVQVNLQVTWTNHTGTGGISISLPTSSQTPATGGLSQIGSVVLENIPLTNTKWPAAVLGTNLDSVILYEFQSSGAALYLSISASGTVSLTGAYNYRNLI